MNDDARAMLVLEKAVIRAKSMLESSQNFRPFALMLYEDGSIKTIENKVNDIENAYEQLRDSMKIRALEGGVDVLAIAIDTLIPERFAKGVPNGIRLHLEEKSQKDKKVSARYIYVPYQLVQGASSGKITAQLFQPVPTGFPAEFLK
ncbi:MAG: hypothetical protein KU38_12110 [Sulfurovum sp. FS08-3]|nr:MAG: hypothetical protein KU38_12110 [Sulfurovum sp. FS08-3]